MPPVQVVFYKEDDGSVPVADWLDQQSAKGQDLCIDRMTRLRDQGHQLRRPTAAPLRGGIYELRARENKVRLRILFFFYGKDRAVMVQGLKKKTQKVPPIEIDRAVQKKKKYEEDPRAHTLHWEPDNEREET